MRQVDRRPRQRRLRRADGRPSARNSPAARADASVGGGRNARPVTTGAIKRRGLIARVRAAAAASAAQTGSHTGSRRHAQSLRTRRAKDGGAGHTPHHDADEAPPKPRAPRLPRSRSGQGCGRRARSSGSSSGSGSSSSSSRRIYCSSRRISIRGAPRRDGLLAAAVAAVGRVNARADGNPLVAVVELGRRHDRGALLCCC